MQRIRKIALPGSLEKSGLDVVLVPQLEGHGGLLDGNRSGGVHLKSCEKKKLIYTRKQVFKTPVYKY